MNKTGDCGTKHRKSKNDGFAVRRNMHVIVAMVLTSSNGYDISTKSLNHLSQDSWFHNIASR